jgi:tagatose-6-phosphate ketose/aldose isomerase
MAAIDSESLIVLYLSSDSHRRLYEIDLAREIRKKKLGKKTIAIGDSVEGLENLADYIFETGNGTVLDDDYRAIIAVLPGQLIGLFSSLSLGLKPDTPSPSGIINRVVSGVTIHPYPNVEGA